MNQAGGSIIKVQAAHVVISIARSLEDIDNSRATLAVLKNRSGKSGTVFHNIRFDNGTSTISCDEVEEFDNSERKWGDEAERLKVKNYQDGVAEVNRRVFEATTRRREDAPQVEMVDTSTGEVIKGEVDSYDGRGNKITFTH
jgi:hypothetical protein